MHGGLVNPRIHPAGLSDADLETLQVFGITSVIAVADSSAGANVESLLSHFDSLVGREATRLERAGLKVGVALGVHPRCLPRRGLRQVLDALPSYFQSPSVVAIGQVGLLECTEVEQDALLQQLALAHEFHKPALVSAPHEGTERVTRKILATLQNSELPVDRIVVEGATGATVRAIRELGFHAALTVHPSHLSVERAVELVSVLGADRIMLADGAGFGASDIVSLSRARYRLEKAGLSRKVVSRVTAENAATVFGLKR